MGNLNKLDLFIINKVLQQFIDNTDFILLDNDYSSGDSDYNSHYLKGLQQRVAVLYKTAGYGCEACENYNECSEGRTSDEYLEPCKSQCKNMDHFVRSSSFYGVE